jgi:hypothetical protein
MNQELIDMARRAGVRDDEHRFEFSEYKYLEAFAADVAAAEREKFCAVLRQLHDSYSLASRSNNIRARGETK